MNLKSTLQDRRMRAIGDISITIKAETATPDLLPPGKKKKHNPEIRAKGTVTNRGGSEKEIRTLESVRNRIVLEELDHGAGVEIEVAYIYVYIYIYIYIYMYTYIYIYLYMYVCM
jgi:hypothetical protein